MTRKPSPAKDTPNRSYGAVKVRRKRVERHLVDKQIAPGGDQVNQVG